MGKATIIATIKLSFLLCIITGISSCADSSGGNTETLSNSNSSKIDTALFKKDKVRLQLVVTKMIQKNKNPFQDKLQFDSLTECFIDSIIYSPDKLRSIAFVIIRNSNRKLTLDPGDLNGHYYNAYYFYCSRNNVQSQIRLYEYSGYSLVRDPSYAEVRYALYENCFKKMSLNSTKDDEIYNMNDTRFWKSSYFNWVIQSSTFEQ